MSLAGLRLEDLRCLRQAELALHPGRNLILGSNGAGKTTLLEAIYLLGRGRSFRTRHSEQLIHHGAPHWLIVGRLDPTPAERAANLIDAPSHTIGLRATRGGELEARFDGRDVASLAELSTRFPVQVIDPGIHRLVEEGPALRRRWFDWTVFHVEPNFIQHWQAYQRALRQRNAALKSGVDPSPWSAELIRYGELITAARARLIEALQPYWLIMLQQLSAEPVELGFSQGWAKDHSLAESLAMHLARDRERAGTQYGPHRFDTPLRLEGRPARDVVSRGQQKVLGAALTLTLSRYVAATTGQTPTLLIDDPAAELDPLHTEALLAAVAAQGGQLIATALRRNEAPWGTADRVFHVEQGGVQQL